MMLNPNQKRLMIPRWRSLRLTIRSRELSGSFLKKGSTSVGSLTPELTSRLEAWRRRPDLISAAELVETAIVDAQEEEAINAALSLLAHGSHAVPLVQTQAALLLSRVGMGSEIPDRIKLNAPEFRAFWRRRTRLYPQNPLGWVELALHDTIDGYIERAKRAILVALQLAPNDRHVLRSASRFFLHCNDGLRAYEVIAKSAAVNNDPWLIASEVALAQHIEINPRFYKRGVAMFDSGMLPRQLTELAGSIATTELVEGNKKKARRYFKTSMLDPNANALAQAEWAAPSFGSELYSASKLSSVEEAHEAMALHLYREGKFSDVYLACEAWMDGEPYSIRPYEFAANTANVLEDHEKADEITRRGLAKRPNAPQLLNCRAYALASRDRLGEAEAVLARIASSVPEWMHLVAEANSGMIAFRRGRHTEAIIRYQQAINGFQRLGVQLGVSASVYLCREMIRARLPEGEKLASTLRLAVKSSNDAALKKAYQGVEELLGAQAFVDQMRSELAGADTKPPSTKLLS
jgi:tetratricopeptide (TPR) repeat protein